MFDLFFPFNSLKSSSTQNAQEFCVRLVVLILTASPNRNLTGQDVLVH